MRNRCHFCGMETDNPLLEHKKVHYQSKGIWYQLTFVGSIGIIELKTGLPIQHICKKCLAEFIQNGMQAADHVIGNNGKPLPDKPKQLTGGKYLEIKDKTEFS